MKIIFFLFFAIGILNSQSINLNQSGIENFLRNQQLLGNIDQKISFTIKPLNLGKFGYVFNDLNTNNFLYSKNKWLAVKLLPVDYNIEFNSHHPYKNNNGSMIPAKGLQQLLSLGFYAEIGPLSIQLKPEFVTAQNKKFDGFPESHYDIIWARRYNLWNRIDLPERFGNSSFTKFYSGQSNIKLNYKNLSFGVSSENIWWGPSIRNSIMMSNNSKGFDHITFNTNKPIKTPIGYFEWQIVSGKLEPSYYTPPNIDKQFQGTNLYVPKINQIKELNDWRYFQGYTLTYSPKWISGLSLGIIRWVQMYSALVEGEYTWMGGNPNYFPIFNNFLRSNDGNSNLENQTDQAAGLFFRWLWPDSSAEIYSEFHYNDAKLNIRDLLLDSDHSRAVTVGLQKIFKSNIKETFYKFSWEWTQLEQTASRLIRNAGSWYMHGWVYHGYTNRGEVLGATIGPGSNSNFFKISRIKNFQELGLSFEIIDQDNDFYYYAFEDSGDYRRYWKDYNLHLNYSNKISNFWISLNLIYGKSLNYQWELINDGSNEYYQNGKDVDNVHLNIKLVYDISF